MNHMKTLFVTSYYGESEGGADISTKLLVEFLTPEISVEVASITSRKLFGVHSLFRYWPMPTSIVAFLLNTPFLDRILAKHLQQIIAKVHPDIIHVHDIMLLPAGVRAAKKARVPCLVTVRDLRFITNIPILKMEDLSCYFSSFGVSLQYLAQQKGWIPALFALPFIFTRPKAIQRALRTDIGVIAISQFVKKWLVSVGVDEKKISVIYNPVPVWKKKKYTSCTGTVFFAPGRLEYYKGFHILIDAMKHFQGENVTLLIAGTGPEEGALRKLVKKYGLNQQVFFLGKIHYNIIKEYYACCTAVLFPSLWPEPLGRVPLEALAAGKICIASAVGGIPEIVPKKHLVVPTSEAFAEKMKEIVLRRNRKITKDRSF